MDSLASAPLRSVRRITLPGPLASIRLRAGLTQREVAAAVGIARSYLSLLERSPNLITLELAHRIAHALGVKVGDVLPRNGQR